MHTSTSETLTAPPLKIKDEGCGEYSYSRALSVGQLSLSPRSFGRPPSNLIRQDKGKEIVRYSDSCSFVQWEDI